LRAKLTLELAIGSLLDGSLDLVVGGTLLEADSQVHNRDVGGGHTHGHAGELAVKVGDDLADSLGGTSAAGNDVLSSTTTTAPVLGGGAIDGLLGGSVRVHSGHQTLNDGEVVVDNLGEGGQAVGCARSVGDDVGGAIVGLLVNAHHVHGGIGRGGGDDDTLGTTLQVSTGLLLGGEDTGRLDDVLGASVLPGDGSGVTLGVELDGLAVDLQVAALDRDGAVEDAVGRIILEHVLLYGRWRSDLGCEVGQTGAEEYASAWRGATYSVLGLDERVVDSNDLDIGVLDGVAEDDTADTAKAIDANLDSHVVCRRRTNGGQSKRGKLTVLAGWIVRVKREWEVGWE